MFLEKVVSWVVGSPFIVQYLIALILVAVAKLCPKLFKFLLEVLKKIMKFKTQNTKSTNAGLKCETTKPIYRLNKATNELEDTGEVVDIQEMVNSYLDTTMSKVLDRLLPSLDTSEDNVAFVSMTDDLDELQIISSKAEDYRKKFGLDDSLSITDIFKVVSQKATELKTKIDNSELLKKEITSEVAKDEEKEVK